MANITFGERMRRARIQTAWTQAELGERVGVTGTTIGNWEKGKTVPERPQKDQIRSILGIGRTGPKSSGAAVPEAAEDQAEAAPAGPSAFGTWLNRTRVDKHLSVGELAQQSGVSAPAIYNIEAGRIANPRSETIRKLERALGKELPAETKEELREESTIEGMGELVDFDPHDPDDLPSAAGVYVLYDISERPVYVGEGGNIKKRIRDHSEKFWFKAPIVETAAYVKIEEEGLRKKVETVLIRFLKSNAVINKKNVDR